MLYGVGFSTVGLERVQGIPRINSRRRTRVNWKPFQVTSSWRGCKAVIKHWCCTSVLTEQPSSTHVGASIQRVARVSCPKQRRRRLYVCLFYPFVNKTLRGIPLQIRKTLGLCHCEIRKGLKATPHTLIAAASRWLPKVTTNKSLIKVK